MPIYEYWCHNCDIWFEALRSISRAHELATCPGCGQPAPRQTPSSFTAFTMRDGYPRRIPDKREAYGPVGPHTTNATPEQKAKAAEEKRRQNWDNTRSEREEKAYRQKHAEAMP